MSSHPDPKTILHCFRAGRATTWQLEQLVKDRRAEVVRLSAAMGSGSLQVEMAQQFNTSPYLRELIQREFEVRFPGKETEPPSDWNPAKKTND